MSAWQSDDELLEEYPPAMQAELSMSFHVIRNPWWRPGMSAVPAEHGPGCGVETIFPKPKYL